MVLQVCGWGCGAASVWVGLWSCKYVGGAQTMTQQGLCSAIILFGGPAVDVGYVFIMIVLKIRFFFLDMALLLI